MARTSARSRYAGRLLDSTALVVSLAGLAAVSYPFIARADTNVLPQGGTVVVGAATIKSNIPGSLDVTTATNRTAINWQSFSIGAGNTVTINQPNSSSLTLNQVVGADPSSIFGSLKSNGQVVLANPNGIWFGPGSHVDVASIVASTATASQAALQAFARGGALMLDKTGKADASIVNDGSISLGAEGLAGLVAPGVANNGIIAARLGRVVLASGTVATLDFYGDGLISFAVGGSVTAHAKDQAGKNLAAAVVNSGTITNAGGTVLMTAAAAKTVVDNTINMSGVVVASAINAKGGEIDLDGGSGTTNVSGELLASSKTASGGTINVTGHNVALAPTARLDVTGAAGGSVAIGGGMHGSGNLAHATDVTLAQGSTITADGTAGAGGSVAVWSDGVTKAGAAITATGTTVGGAVETSGHYLDIAGVSVKAGSWLLDPFDLEVGTAAAAAINIALQSGNVTLQTTVSTTSGQGTVVAGSGDINILSPITWSGTETFSLTAYRNVNIDAPITASGGGTLAIQTNTGISVAGTYAINAPVSFTGSGGALDIDTTGTKTSLAGYASYSLIHNATDLQGATNASIDYALATDLNLVGVSLAPITNAPLVFEGLGHTISNATISDQADTNVGFFGSIGSGHAVRDLTLANESVTGIDTAANNVGGVAGSNSGLIFNVSASGSVVTGARIGGLVGTNTGTVSDSYSSATVSEIGVSLANLFAGGLVGTNSGTVIGAYYDGSVTASNTGTLTTTVGGLVGVNSALVMQSYNLGSVNGATASTAVTAYAGGLVGRNNSGGIVRDGYDIGTVTVSSGFANAGGIVGLNSSGASIVDVYAAGAIGASSGAAGGIAGSNSGSLTSIVWDNTATGQTFSFGAGGLATSQTGSFSAYSVSSYASLATGGSTATTAFFTTFTNGDNNVWYMVPGSMRPILESEYSSAIHNTHQLALVNLSLAGNYTVPADLIATTTGPGAFLGDVWNTVTASSAYGFVPLGYSSAGSNASPANFTGTFDGLGHTIFSLTIDNNNADNLGLFSEIGSGGLVENLVLSGGSVTANTGAFQAFGMLAGINAGTISGVSATGPVTGFNQTGGLVGQNDGTILNSFATGAVSGFQDVGGLVGLNQGGTIQFSYATGSVSAGSTSASAAGGLVGANTTAGLIDQSFATGDVSGFGSQIGGLVGQNGLGVGDTATISNSYALGNVFGSDGPSIDVGGLVGLNAGLGATISDSFDTGSVNGTAGSTGYFAGGNSGSIVGGYYVMTSGANGGVGTGADTSTGFASLGALEAAMPAGLSSSFWADGNGTSRSTPFLINNAGPVYIGTNLFQPISGVAGLEGFNALIQNAQGAGNYYLAGNIDMSAAGEFAPITGVSDTYALNGIFDGLGYSISGLTISGSGDANVGLFATFFGTVQNLTIANSTVIAGAGTTNAAILVGDLEGNASNITLVNDTITDAANSTLATVGLLAGRIGEGTASNVSITGGLVSLTQSTGLTAVGGAVGDNGGIISLATAGVTINVSDSGFATLKVGGLVGFNESLGSISGSHATGGSVSVTVTATGTSAYAGGFVGENAGHVAALSSADDSVTLNANGPFETDAAGGFVGFNDTTGVISLSSAFGAVAITGGASSTAYAGGFVGENNNLIDQSFATGSAGGGTDTGGFVGYNFSTGSAIITNSYALGAVNGVSGGRVGGFVGDDEDDGTIKDSFSAGLVTSNGATAGGFAGAYGGNSAVSNFAVFSEDLWLSGQSAFGVGDGSATSGLAPVSLAALQSTAIGSLFPSTAGVWGNLGNHTTPYLLANSGPVLYDGYAGFTGLNSLSPFYVITTGAQLEAITDTGNYLLAGNLDLTSFANFTPIADFNGVFDGLGFSISNVTINDSLTVANGLQVSGLFRVFGDSSANAVIEHLHLSNLSLTVTNTGGATTAAGGLVGEMGENAPNSASPSGGGTLSDVSVAGTISANNVAYVGGILGEGELGLVSLSSSTAAITASATDGTSVGGLVGHLSQGFSSDNVSVTQSFASGSITVVNAVSGIAQVGGLVGLQGTDGTILDSYSMVSITVSGTSSVGGIVGQFNGGVITDVVAIGAITSSGTTRGLAGTAATSITDGYYADTTGQSTDAAGGSLITLSNLEGSLPSFQNSVWGDANGQTTPYLLANAGPVYTAAHGSLTQYIAVTTAAQVEAIGVASGGSLTGNYVLVTDIDLSGIANFSPIGLVGSNVFTGTFDGLDFTLKNLTISNASSDIGLFSHIGSGGTVENLFLNGTVTETGGNSQSGVGMLAGFNEGHIIHVSVAGTVTALSNAQLQGVGGLVGLNRALSVGDGVITDSSADVTVTASYFVGGLVGQSSSGTLDSDWASGPVVGVDGPSLSQAVGGLVGISTGDSISNSYATGTVSGTDRVGGFVGDLTLNGSYVVNAFATGAVTGSTNLGGFAGRAVNSANGTISSDFWTDGLATDGATSLGTTSLSSVAALLGTLPGSFSSTIWADDGGLTTPYLSANLGPVFTAADGATPLTPITTAAAFQSMTDGHSYVLFNDIAFTGFGNFTPIATFSGIFDGLGHKISGISINDTNANSVGIFGSLTGTFENATIDQATVTISPANGGAADYGVLAGSLTGTVANVTLSSDTITDAGNATNAQFVGLLAGSAFSDTVSNVTITTGTISLTNDSALQFAGGLIGSQSSGSITSATASVAITVVSGPNVTVGGLVGANGQFDGGGAFIDASGVSSSSVSLTISGTGDPAFSTLVGGLVGDNYGGISSSTVNDVTVAVAIPGTGLANTPAIGGLVGKNEFDGSISGSSATGGSVSLADAATGSLTTLTSAVGGLVGANAGSITSSTVSTGTIAVTGSGVSLTIDIGGLVGWNDTSAAIASSTARGILTANLPGTGSNINAGGLVGDNFGTISGSSIGNSFADVSLSIAADLTTGNANAGGLVGTNEGGGVVFETYALGNVVASGASGSDGGLVGANNSGGINQSFAAGSVTGISFVGGFVGFNEGLIANGYAIGAVNGAGAGGFVGRNVFAGNFFGSIDASYALGVAANGFAGSTGGGSITNSFWDTATTGSPSLQDGSGGQAVGLTTSALQGRNLGSDWSAPAGLFPYLNWQVTSGTAQAVQGSVTGPTVAGLGVGVIGGGTSLTSLLAGTNGIQTFADGSYYVLLAPGTIGSAETVGAYLTSAAPAATLALGTTGSVTLDPIIYTDASHGTVTVQNDSDGSLSAALGTLTGAFPGVPSLTAGSAFTVTSSVLALGSGTALKIENTAASFLIDQAPARNLTVTNSNGSGVVSLTSGLSLGSGLTLGLSANEVDVGALTVGAGGALSLAASTISIGGTVDATAASVELNTTGSLTDVFVFNANSLVLDNGSFVLSDSINDIVSVSGNASLGNAVANVTLTDNASNVAIGAFAASGSFSIANAASTITVSGALSAGAGLELDAGTSITLGAVSITASSAVLRADTAAGGGGIIETQGGHLTATSGPVAFYYHPTPFPTATDFSAFVTAPSGFTAYMTVDNASDLGEIGGNLSGDYFLNAANLSLTGAFTPIGNASTPFTGIFAGGGQTISGLTIAGGFGIDLGLFGVIGSGGIVENFGIVGGNVSGLTNVGMAVGLNLGVLANVTVTGGTVTGFNNVGGVIGNNEFTGSSNLTASATIHGGIGNQATVNQIVGTGAGSGLSGGGPAVILDEALLTGTVFAGVSSSTPVSGGTIGLVIDGTSFGSATTDSSGTYRFLIGTGSLTSSNEVVVELTSSGGALLDDGASFAAGSVSLSGIDAGAFTIVTAAADLQTALSALTTSISTAGLSSQISASGIVAGSGVTDVVIAPTSASFAINAAITATSGTVFLTTSGGMTQASSAGIAAGTLDLEGSSSAAAGYALTSNANAIGTLSGATTGPVDLVDTADLAVTLSSSVPLTILDTGSVTFPGTLTLGGTTNLTGATVTFDGSIQGAFALTINGNAIFGGDIGNVDVALTALTLDQTSPGTISDSFAIHTDTLSLEGASGTYVLTGAGNNIATLVGNTGSITVDDGGNAMTLGTITVAGDLAVTGAGQISLGGNITTTSGGVVDLAGAGGVVLASSVTIDTTNGGNNASGADVTLGSVDDFSAGSGLTINAGTTGIVTIGAVGEAAAPTSLAITAASIHAGAITTDTLILNQAGSFSDSAAISVTTSLSLGGVGGYTLNGAGNDIADLLANTGSITVDDGGNPLALEALTLTGGLTVTGIGPVSLNGEIKTAGGAVSLAGSETLDTVSVTIDTTNGGGVPGGAAISLGSLDDFSSGNGLTLNAGSNGAITIGTVGGNAAPTSLVMTGASITAGAITTDTLTLNQSGNFSDAAAISVTTSLSLGGVGGYTLNGAGNEIAVLVANTGTVNLVDAVALTVNATSLTGALAITDSAPIALAGNITTGGAVSLTGGGGISLNSSIAINSGNAAITLAAVAGSGNTLNLASGTGAITLSGVSVGSLVLSASPLTLNGGVYSIGNSGYSFGAATLNGAITLGQTTSFGALTLAANSILTDVLGMHFATIDGNFALSLSGNGDFSGPVGGTTALTSLTASGGTIAFHGLHVGTLSVPANETLGAGSYAIGSGSFGAVTLDGGGGVVTLVNGTSLGTATLASNTSITASAGVNFLSTLDGSTSSGQSLAITGPVGFAGAIGGSHSLNSLTLNQTGSVSDTFAISATSLSLIGGGSYALTGANTVGSLSATAGALTFDNGGHNLTLAGVSVTGGLALGNIATLILDGNISTSSVAVDLTGAAAISLATSVAIDTTIGGGGSAGAAITLANIIGGANTLSLTAGVGAITLHGVTTSGNLALSGSATTLDAGTYAIGGGTFSPGAVTLNGAIVLGQATSFGATTLGSNVSLDASAANAPVTLGAVSGAHSLGISAGSGAVTLNGVSDAGLTVTTTGTTTLNAGSYSVGSPLTLGATTLSGVVTLGQNTTFGAVTLGSAVTLNSSAANAAITLGAVTGGANTLTLTSGTGMVTLNGIATTGNLVVGTSPITLNAGSYTFSGGAFGPNTTLNGLGQTLVFHQLTTFGVVTLASDTTLQGPFSFFSPINGAHALTISGDVVFQDAIGATTPLASLSVTGTTSFAASGGAVTTTGTQSYGGAVTLNHDAALTGSSVSFGTTVDGGFALTVTGDANFTGAVGAGTALTTLDVAGNAVSLAAVNADTIALATNSLTLNGAVVATSVAITAHGGSDTIDLGTASGGQLHISDAALADLGSAAVTIGDAGANVAVAGTTALPNQLTIVALNVTVSGAVSAADADAGSLTVSLTSGGSFTELANASLTFRGGVSIAPVGSGSATITIDGLIDPAGITLNAGTGSVSLGAAASLVSTGSIIITADTFSAASVSGSTAAVSAPTVQVNGSASNINIGTATSGTLVLTDQDLQTLAGGANGTNVLTIGNANSTITVTGTVTLPSGIRLTGSSVDIASDAVLASGTSVIIDAGQTNIGAGATISGTYVVGSLSVPTGTVLLGGDTVINASGSVTLADIEGTGSGGQSLTVNATSGSVELDTVGTTVALSSLAVTLTTGDITLGSVRTTGAQIYTGISVGFKSGAVLAISGQPGSGAISFATNAITTVPLTGSVNASVTAGVITLDGETAGGGIGVGTGNGTLVVGQDVLSSLHGSAIVIGDANAGIAVGGTVSMPANLVLNGASITLGSNAAVTGAGNLTFATNALAINGTPLAIQNNGTVVVHGTNGNNDIILADSVTSSALVINSALLAKLGTGRVVIGDSQADITQAIVLPGNVSLLYSTLSSQLIQLTGTAYTSFGSSTVLAGVTIDIVFDGRDFTTTTNNLGQYFDVISGSATGHHDAVIVLTSGATGSAFYDFTGTTLSGLNVYGATLYFQADGTGVASAVGNLATQLSALTTGAPLDGVPQFSNAGITTANSNSLIIDVTGVATPVTLPGITSTGAVTVIDSGGITLNGVAAAALTLTTTGTTTLNPGRYNAGAENAGYGASVGEVTLNETGPVRFERTGTYQIVTLPSGISGGTTGAINLTSAALTGLGPDTEVIFGDGVRSITARGTVGVPGGIVINGDLTLLGDAEIDTQASGADLIFNGAVTPINNKLSLTLSTQGDIMFEDSVASSESRLYRLIISAAHNVSVNPNQLRDAKGTPITTPLNGIQTPSYAGLYLGNGTYLGGFFTGGSAILNADGKVDGFWAGTGISGTLSVGLHSLESDGDVSIIATTVEGRIVAGSGTTDNINVTAQNIIGNSNTDRSSLTGGSVTVLASISDTNISATRSANVSATDLTNVTITAGTVANVNVTGPVGPGPDVSIVAPIVNYSGPPPGSGPGPHPEPSPGPIIIATFTSDKGVPETSRPHVQNQSGDELDSGEDDSSESKFSKKKNKDGKNTSGRGDEKGRPVIKTYDAANQYLNKLLSAKKPATY